MGNIKLPTYSEIMPNEVFGRKVDPLTFGKEEFPATQIIKIARFKVPLKDDVINLIRNSANDPTVNQTLQLILSMLPDAETRRISEGNEYCLKHLRNHCPDYLEEGSTYVEVLNGIIPTEALDRVKVAKLYSNLTHFKFENESEIYSQLIKKLGQNEWTLRIKLEEGMLPKISELEHLIAQEVKVSKMLSVEGQSKFYSDAASHARILYNASNLMGYIRDSSRQFLNQRACLTAKDVVACITTSNLIKEGIVSEILQGHKEPYEGASNN